MVGGGRARGSGRKPPHRAWAPLAGEVDTEGPLLRDHDGGNSMEKNTGTRKTGRVFQPQVVKARGNRWLRPIGGREGAFRVGNPGGSLGTNEGRAEGPC